MKDQNNIEYQESDNVRWNRGLDLFIESVYKPDTILRQCAHNQNCYNEVRSGRDKGLEDLRT